MKSLKLTLAALTVGLLAAVAYIVPAQAAQCSAQIFNQTVPFTCPDPVAGPQGAQGEQGEQGVAGVDGVDGADGADGAAGVDGQDGADGKDGKDGKDGVDGKSFSDAELHEGLATIGALNIPHVENKFAASLNGGFYESDTAVGIGAGYRFDKTWQFGGSVAVGTSGGDVAGKAALTGQW